MSSLYVSIFGRQQVAAYLFEQLVCYCYLLKTASGGLFMSNLCVIVIFEK